MTNQERKIAIITSLSGGLGHYNAHLAGPLSKLCTPRFITYPQLDLSGTVTKEIADSFVKKYIKWPKFYIDESNPQSIITIADYLKSRHIDIVNIHIATTVKRKISYFTTLILYCKKILKTKFVFTLHDVLPFDEDKKLVKLLRVFYELGDQFTVGNEKEKQKLLRNFQVKESHVTIIRHGIYNLFNRDLYDNKIARSFLGIPQEQTVILFFGFLREYKGFEYLIKAAKILAKRKVKFLIYVASGLKYAPKDLADRSLRLIHKLGLQDYFMLNLNYLDTSDIEAVFKAADISALPYTHASQSGVMMMAFGFKNPVVITEAFFDKEWVNKKAGLVAKIADPESLADKITYLISNKAEAKKMGEYGYNYGVEHLNWKDIANKYFEVYKKLS